MTVIVSVFWFAEEVAEAEPGLETGTEQEDSRMQSRGALPTTRTVCPKQSRGVVLDRTSVMP